MSRPEMRRDGRAAVRYWRRWSRCLPWGAPSRASDIYALAATAFALLTGSAPAGVLPAWEGIEPPQAEQLEAAIRLGRRRAI